MALNDVVNAAKKRKGMTNIDLAEVTGLTLSNIDKITSGHNDNPKLTTLQAICKALDLTLDDLDDTPPRKAKTPTSEEPEAGAITLEESNALLVSLGYIQPGEDLSDRDLKFLSGVIEILDSWFAERGQRSEDLSGMSGGVK